jgi:hypothetical protein
VSGHVHNALGVPKHTSRDLDDLKTEGRDHDVRARPFDELHA